MPSLKLIYFDARGRAETIRMVLAVADVKYEDYRMKKENLPQEWKDLKPKMPFGQVPVLEDDGRKIAQSMSICRYLAEKYDLMGRTPVEKAAIDGCCEWINDIREQIIAIKLKKEPEKDKAKKLEEFNDITLTEKLTILDGCLKKNKGGMGYFYGDKISLADIHFFAVCEDVLDIYPDALHPDKFEKLAELFERIKMERKINEYLEKRSDTESN